jgi:hypothetical protein
VKKIFSILFALVLMLSLGLATAAPVLAGTIIHVPGDYSTIHAALNASSDGDTIMVAAGEYDAFQVIDKNNISIISTEGATVTTAVYVPGLGGDDVWVMAAVTESENINIEGINFDGTDVSEDAYICGIVYADSTGRIADLTVENIFDGLLGAGVAILGDAGTCTVEITGSTISNNRIGIYFFGDSSLDSLEAHFNNIVGNSDYGVLNDGFGGTVNATHNWWGNASGPYHESENPDGLGDEVSDNVDFRPWLEAEVGAAKTETVIGGGIVDAKEEADTEVVVDGTGTTTVTVAKYNANPGGPPASGFITMGKYIDVYVPDTTQVTEIEIRLYYTDDELTAAGIDEESLQLFWLNGDVWDVCSESGVNPASINGYSGYIWAIITDDTQPSLDDLEGLELGDGGTEGPSQPPSGGCFIATAAYGTDTAKEIDILREFRDEVLLPNSLGSKLVSFYYKTSPPIANLISQHEVLRTAVRVGFVAPIVAILNWSHDLWSAGGS